MFILTNTFVNRWLLTTFNPINKGVQQFFMTSWAGLLVAR